MGKRKVYQVSLVSLGFIDENLHYGPFSRDWWETRCVKNTTKTPILYPIRINMKTLVILQNIQFFVTVIQGHIGSLQQPGYICEAGDLKSATFNNPSDEQLYYAGPGFRSSFYYSIGAKKERTLFVQEINKKNSIIKIPNDVWQKVGVLHEHRGVDLFGINYLENIGLSFEPTYNFSVPQLFNLTSQLLKLITSYYTKIKFFKLQGFNNQNIYSTFNLIETFKQNLNYLTIDINYFGNDFSNRHIELSSKFRPNSSF
ncbi:hypothetical protein C1646_762788 [Rhizophagus diaphanus]|nr:hypothetical protein C1646_762788 [Rhizophagus diaphanus] [Rhizophagus sp. MUCL 43196]